MPIVPGFNHIKRPPVGFRGRLDYNIVSTVYQPGSLCTQSEVTRQLLRPVSGWPNTLCARYPVGIASRAMRMTTLRFTRSA